MLGIFLDTETNGLNSSKHRIIEIAYAIVDVETGKEHESFESRIALSRELWEQGDKASLSITKTTWEENQTGLTAEAVTSDILDSFKRCNIQRGQSVFICQNPSFDRTFFAQLIDADRQEGLNWPYHWLDLASMYWAMALTKKTTPPWITGLSKNKIASVYGLGEEGLPHRAMNGVRHLIACYDAVVGFPKSSL